MDVMIPAKYSLLDSKEMVVHELQGKSGAHISHYILADLQQHLPQLVFYTHPPSGWHASLVHLKGSVDIFDVGRGKAHWGEFNQESHQQLGTVQRHIDVQVLIQLENDQHQVLWSQVFSRQEEQSESFSLHSNEAYHALAGERDILQGKILSGISDFVQQSDMEEDALSHLPRAATVRQQMMIHISRNIAESFYGRTEQRLEFR